jgi:hypothetical protein
VEAESSLVRAQGGVVLNAEAIVDADLEVIVFPGDAELDHTFGDGSDLEGSPILGVLLEEGGVLES